jgi:hypothetical protein
VGRNVGSSVGSIVVVTFGSLLQKCDKTFPKTKSKLLGANIDIVVARQRQIDIQRISTKIVDFGRRKYSHIISLIGFYGASIQHQIGETGGICATH